MQLLLENEFVRKSLIAVLIIIGAVLLVRVGQRLVNRYGSDPQRIYAGSRSIRRIGGLLAMTAIVLLFSAQVGDLLTVLTVIGAGMAIALSQVLLSIAGWMRISMLTTYTHGDRIEINGVRGDVVDIRLLRTSLMEIGGWVDGDQSTGRIVHIPNGWIYEYALFNYTRTFNFIWNELTMTVTYDSDWKAARDIMQQLADETAPIVEKQARDQIRRLSTEFLIHYSVMTPFVYARAMDSGISLTLRYLCEVRKRRGSAHSLTVSILDLFHKHEHIEFAYPSFAIYPKGPAPSDSTPPASLR